MESNNIVDKNKIPTHIFASDTEIFASDIADGINIPDKFYLCIEISKRYNNYNSLLEALKSVITNLEQSSNTHLYCYDSAKDAIQKAEQ